MDKNVKLQRRRLISKLESDLESDESSVSQMDPIARFKECTKNLDSESVLTLSDDSDSNHSWYSNNSTIILDSDSQKSESVIRSKRSQRLALEKTKNAPTQSATCELSSYDSDSSKSSTDSIIFHVKENSKVISTQLVNSSNDSTLNTISTNENYKLKDHKRLVNKFLNEANSSESKKLIDELGVQIKHIPKLDEIKCHKKAIMKRNKQILTYIQHQYLKRIMRLRMLKNALVKDKQKIKLFSTIVNKTYALLLEHTIEKNLDLNF